MNDELHVEEINGDDHEPATKGDVRRAVDELAHTTKRGFDHVDRQLVGIKSDITGLDRRMDVFEERMDRFERSQHATLDVLKTIDQKLTGLPEKVERLHRTVFPQA